MRSFSFTKQPNPSQNSDDMPLIMGILNVTPDSFSDGGLHFSTEEAIRVGGLLAWQGADIVDVGGESTRPGAPEVPEDEELRRIEPVVDALVQQGIAVSIDTRKPRVAARALHLGASIVNDVTGLKNPEMRAVCAKAECTVCIMHMKGDPSTMQLNPTYENVVEEVQEALLAQAQAAIDSGISKSKIWIDPGIGFGKTMDHNLRLLRDLSAFVETEFPVLIGVSRKSFLGRLTEVEDPLDRLEATLSAQTWAQSQGVKVLRVHEVRSSRRAALVAAAIMEGKSNR